MAKILVWVNTYNREKLLERFYTSVEKQKKSHDVDVFVFHDHSGRDYEDLKKHRLTKIFYSSNQHFGKERYWELINIGFDTIKNYRNEYDLFIKTDDDMILCDNFFDISLEYWNLLNKHSSKVFSLDILSAPKQRGRTLKGDTAPTINLSNGVSVYATQWLDMNCIFNIKALAQIDYTIKNCRSSSKTSGVGLWLTRTFSSLGYKFFQTPVSLLIHRDHVSQMHREERKNSPLITTGLK